MELLGSAGAITVVNIGDCGSVMDTGRDADESWQTLSDESGNGDTH